ncbi:exonuclease SbcCD subunit D [Tessaracoccus antarcticus]|uniref:Nuclease SbcCD subunit D n=1 Tax=Tessaracoccus antarcticus TaxID=2479848 RepID=A0A3M0GBH4_9ACTN|nr:exonuclease SbcCD subunit D [Tessaracoccus antarcticus]RMB62391.1 exonuclease SbcCD subunit D [Tessaracoccus antarcticus]
MRLLHTSDWHLGRTLHGVDLMEHQAAFLDHLVDVVRSEQVDAVLVAGDVYDRAIPPVAAVELLNDTLLRLTEHTRVIVTPGNHDSATRLGFAASLLRDRLVVRSRLENVGTPVEVPSLDGECSALVYAVPYLDPDMVRHRLAGPELDGGGAPIIPARSHEAVATAAMRRIHDDLRTRRGVGPRIPAVLMAHAFVVGGEASESERDIRVGGVDSVPLGALTGPGRDAATDLSALDYLALGHLHGPQRIGRDLDPHRRGPVARYSGSPLAFSFSEMHHTKSSALVSMDVDGVSDVQLVGTPLPRRLSEASGTLEHLLSRAFDEQAQDWVRVLVTDTVRPAQLHAKVKDRFPHALVVQHRPAQPVGTDPLRAVTAAHDPVEVSVQFVTDVSGASPSTAETDVLRRAYEAALAGERSA